jgi:hypothetical protein
MTMWFVASFKQNERDIKNNFKNSASCLNCSPNQKFISVQQEANLPWESTETLLKSTSNN